MRRVERCVLGQHLCAVNREHDVPSHGLAREETDGQPACDRRQMDPPLPSAVLTPPMPATGNQVSCQV